MGPDTYTLTESEYLSFGGAVAAQQKATTDANSYCVGKGREFLALSYQTIPQGGSDAFSLTFRCLVPGDPELRQRPFYQRTPDVVIEQRGRN
jgi:hypothetical protein